MGRSQSKNVGLGVKIMERPDYSKLAPILEKMNREGGFTASILSRDDGLLMASAASPTTNREVVAAMAGHVGSTVDRVRNELRLGHVRDITLRCTEGKVVFKRIASKDETDYIIAAIMTRNVRYHARAIGKAATQIRRVLRIKA